MSIFTDQSLKATTTCDTRMEVKLKVNDNEDAFEMLEQNQPQLGLLLSPQEDRRLLRKIDFRLIPVLFFSYLLQYLDKQTMNYSSILGLQTDMNLRGQDYSWASSLFYFGYLSASGAVAFLVIRWPIGRFMSGSMGIWAAILLLTILCKSASGLWAARFCLGFVEASVAPSISLIISMWYKRSEQTIRQSAWFMGNVTGGLVGGLLGYGMGHIHTMAAWKALYLLFGCLTLAWSMVCYFAIPDSPMSAKFLSEEDRAKAVERVQDNLTGIKNHQVKRYQMVEALLDPKTWLLVLFQFSQNVPNGGVGSFASIVVEGFGFTTLDTLLVQMIGTGFQMVFVVISTIGSTYLTNTRTYWMTFNTTMALIGTIMIRQIDSDYIWSRFMGYCLIIAFSANFPLTMTMITSNTAGFTKKSTVTSMVFVAYCLGNIVGPQIMFSREAPSYPSGFAGMLVCFACSAILSMLLRFYCIWENEKRDASVITVGGYGENSASTSSACLNLSDKTDRELPQFRYVY